MATFAPWSLRPMIAGEVNIEIRTGRRLQIAFGFGPDSDPVILTGATWDGVIADANGATLLDISPYLANADDAEGREALLVLDVPDDVVDDTITASGKFEINGDLGAGRETYLSGQTVLVTSLVP